VPSLLRFVPLGRVSCVRQPFTELRDAAAKRASHLRQALRSEDEEQHAEEHEHFPDADSERHGYARNGVTAFVAWAAVSAFGNEGPETIVPAAMLDRIARCRDSLLPICAATPLRSLVRWPMT